MQASEIQFKTAELQRKKVKIDLLTHELAYWKRMKFGVKSESLSVVQRKTQQRIGIKKKKSKRKRLLVFRILDMNPFIKLQNE
jgi:hypothetical protein